MYQDIEAIALRMVRYNDRHSILSAYTRQGGRMALLVPAGPSAGARRTRALLMPMARFECVASVSAGRDVCTFRELRPIGFPPTGNPVRGALALFAADLLASLLREPMADAGVYSFVAEVADALWSPGLSRLGAANMPLVLMVGMARRLGIEPDWSTYTPGAVLDLVDGIFRQAPPAHGRFLASDDAAAARALRRLTPRTARLYAMDRTRRGRALDAATRYFALHVPGFSEPPSLEVLRHTFDF